MNATLIMKFTGIVIISVLMLPGQLIAQKENESLIHQKNLSQQMIVVNGYEKDISGEKIDYHSCHPEANSALLVRCEDNTQFIEWETAAAPTGTENVTFAWIAGYSSGTSSIDHNFHLLVNGKELISFITPKGGKPGVWSVNGAENS